MIAEPLSARLYIYIYIYIIIYTDFPDYSLMSGLDSTLQKYYIEIRIVRKN